MISAITGYALLMISFRAIKTLEMRASMTMAAADDMVEFRQILPRRPFSPSMLILAFLPFTVWAAIGMSALWGI